MSHAHTHPHEHDMNAQDINAVIANIGSCGKPCDQTCDEPCDDRPAPAGSFWTQMLKNSLWNTLDLCFDDVYAEPKKILIVGGCRQMDLSQHIALLLPAADITLVDPDEAVAQKAKEEVCCRFKFIAAPLEALPFESDEFDLTIAHNFFAYPDQWERALSELGRVTNKNLLLSVHRPLLWNLASKIGGFKGGMAALGSIPPKALPEQYDFLTHLLMYAKIKTKLAPFPWNIYMTEMRPVREEKLVLTP